jgi:hypothetical protein
MGVGATDDKGGDGVEEIFAEFNRSWMTYWDAYVNLQNQLYESIKAAREVSAINQAQRELFASMPRRMDYMPLGQINRGLDSAVSKLEELEKALSVGEEMCKTLQEATEVLKTKARKTKEGLLKVKR